MNVYFIKKYPIVAPKIPCAGIAENDLKIARPCEGVPK